MGWGKAKAVFMWKRPDTHMSCGKLPKIFLNTNQRANKPRWKIGAVGKGGYGPELHGSAVGRGGAGGWMCYCVQRPRSRWDQSN